MKPKIKFCLGWMLIPVSVETYFHNGFKEQNCTTWSRTRANIRECFRLNRKFLK